MGRRVTPPLSRGLQGRFVTGGIERVRMPGLSRLRALRLGASMSRICPETSARRAVSSRSGRCWATCSGLIGRRGSLVRDVPAAGRAPGPEESLGRRGRSANGRRRASTRSDRGGLGVGRAGPGAGRHATRDGGKRGGVRRRGGRVAAVRRAGPRLQADDAARLPHEPVSASGAGVRGSAAGGGDVDLDLALARVAVVLGANEEQAADDPQRRLQARVQGFRVGRNPVADADRLRTAPPVERGVRRRVCLAPRPRPISPGAAGDLHPDGGLGLEVAA
jgi:hypothetical protein